MRWENTTLTQKGQALFDKAITGTSIEITKAVTGAGTVPITNLIMQTDVTDAKQTVTVNPPIKYDDSIVLPVIITNTELQTGYTIHQVGVFAKDPDEGEILMFIAQSETGVEIPAITENPSGFTAEYHYTIKTSNASTISVTVDSAGLLTMNSARELFATKDHSHTLSEVTGGEQLQIEDGGTGAATAAEAYKNLAERGYVSDDSPKNANAATEPGIYFIYYSESDYASLNYPQKLGFMCVYIEPIDYSNRSCIQIFYGAETCYQRYTGNVDVDEPEWTEWKEFSGLDAKNAIKGAQPRRNLLFNADFLRLINSSGVTTFTGSYEECIDGWILASNTSGASGAIHISEGEGIVCDADNTKLYQVINKNSIKLSATYTVSVEINGVLKQFTAMPYNEKTAENMWFGYDYDTNNGIFEIQLNQGDVVTRAKVEEGTVCTLQAEYAADHAIEQLRTKYFDAWGNKKQPLVPISEGGTGKRTAAAAYKALAYRDYVGNDNAINANSLTKDGYYIVFFWGDADYASLNYPISKGFIRVYSEPDHYDQRMCTQIFFDVDSGTTYQRSTSNAGATDETWSEWKKPVTSDIPIHLRITETGTLQIVYDDGE